MNFLGYKWHSKFIFWMILFMKDVDVVLKDVILLWKMNIVLKDVDVVNHNI